MLYLATQSPEAPLKGLLPALRASAFLLHLCGTNTHLLLGTLIRLRAEHLCFCPVALENSKGVADMTGKWRVVMKEEGLREGCGEASLPL